MGKQWKQWQTLFSWAPKLLQMVTAAMKLKDSCPWDEKLWQTKQSIKKQSHYFGDKGPQSQSYGFSSSYVWMWEWTIKKAEHWKIDAFELWCWRRLWRVPWTAKRPNQSILKEISPDYSLEGLMLNPKLQYSGHLMQRANSLWPHGLQHARLPCPSPTPGACSNSCPSSHWCHPTISSLSSPSPPAPNPSQHQSLFQWVNSSHEVAKVLEFQL